MKFTPKTEKEIAEANLLSEGEYDFEIIGAEDKVSSRGNDMIYLKLKVFADDGGFKFVDDYLLEAIEYKLRHAAEGTGLLEKYETGHLLASDFLGKCGKVKLVIQKDKNGQYPDKNAVKDYVIDREARAQAGTRQAATNSQAPIELDDEIPFAWLLALGVGSAMTALSGAPFMI